jgi:hypothetical protein
MNNPINLGPNIWGPHLWKTIHFVALGYPMNPIEEDKKNYKIFYESFKYTIPCIKCRNHYSQHLEKIPIDDQVLRDKYTLLNWTIDLHNTVNKLNNKKVYSYDEATDLIISNFQETKEEEKPSESAAGLASLFG